jgi:hypothetical protein
MKLFNSALLSQLLTASSNAFSGGGHDHGNEHGYAHGITDVQALSLGIDVAKFFSEKDAGLEIGQLTASWAAIPKEKQSMFQQRQENTLSIDVDTRRSLRRQFHWCFPEPSITAAGC